ncbi:MAG: nucleotide exchange factor GrpE [Rhodoglobus sp.]
MSDNNRNNNESTEPATGDPAADSATADNSATAGSAHADSASADSAAADSAAADSAQSAGTPPTAEDLSAEDQRLLDDASRDLVSDMRDQMLRAQAELVNFRTRVERDRVANREAVIADVVRSMLPALDDLDRADQHGDLVEGTPLDLVAQKIRFSFERFGLRKIGEKGEKFDPAFHEAVVHFTDPEARENTIADVVEPGYILGERVVRAARVAVSGPAD